MSDSLKVSGMVPPILLSSSPMMSKDEKTWISSGMLPLRLLSAVDGNGSNARKDEKAKRKPG